MRFIIIFFLKLIFERDFITIECKKQTQKIRTNEKEWLEQKVEK